MVRWVQVGQLDLKVPVVMLDHPEHLDVPMLEEMERMEVQATQDARERQELQDTATMEQERREPPEHLDTQAAVVDQDQQASQDTVADQEDQDQGETRDQEGTQDADERDHAETLELQDTDAVV